MESTGMMRWPPERDSPLRQGAGTGLDWFSVATEASGSGTPGLGFFLEVLVYIRGVAIRNKSGGSPRRPRGRGARPPPGRALHPRGPPDVLLPPIYISIYPKNIQEHNRSGVPTPEASIATENQSRPVPAPCRRGQSFSGGHLHHPGALHDEEGVVLPRG